MILLEKSEMGKRRYEKPGFRGWFVFLLKFPVIRAAASNGTNEKSAALGISGTGICRRI